MIGDSAERDKYLMGCALFVLYSRSRWSDIAQVEYLELDAVEVEGRPFGFIESSTRHQKTGTTALKKAMQMPLVSPVLGVSDVEWAHIFMEVLMGMGLDPTEDCSLVQIASYTRAGFKYASVVRLRGQFKKKTNNKPMFAGCLFLMYMCLHAGYLTR